MSDHLSEQELVLLYYGDGDNRAVCEAHLAECAACRAALAQLSDLLAAVKTSEAPEPLHGLEERLWRKLRPQLDAPPRRRWFVFPVRQWVYAAGITAALALAFLAGRFSPQEPSAPPTTVAAPGDVRERILLVTVADHLDRSQVMLLELLNADSTGELDLSRERQRAAELVADNRLFRLAATRDGDAATASVLDDLERVLLEIGNAPDSLGADEFADWRQAIENKGLILKVRVLGSQARERLVHPRADTALPVM